MPPRKKAKAADETTPADVAEALKPVEMTSAELRHALEGKGIKAKAATARPALVKMLQEALEAGLGASAAPVDISQSEAPPRDTGGRGGGRGRGRGRGDASTATAMVVAEESPARGEADDDAPAPAFAPGFLDRAASKGKNRPASKSKSKPRSSADGPDDPPHDATKQPPKKLPKKKTNAKYVPEQIDEVPYRTLTFARSVPPPVPEDTIHVPIKIADFAQRASAAMDELTSLLNDDETNELLKDRTEADVNVDDCIIEPVDKAVTRAIHEMQTRMQREAEEKARVERERAEAAAGAGVTGGDAAGATAGGGGDAASTEAPRKGRKKPVKGKKRKGHAAHDDPDSDDDDAIPERDPANPGLPKVTDPGSSLAIVPVADQTLGPSKREYAAVKESRYPMPNFAGMNLVTEEEYARLEKEASTKLVSLQEAYKSREEGLSKRKDRKKFKTATDVWECVAEPRETEEDELETMRWRGHGIPLSAETPEVRKRRERPRGRVVPGKDVLVFVSIHNPANPEQVLEELVVLGTTTLEEWKDAIDCVSNLQAAEIGLPPKRDGYLFVEGVFYNDMRGLPAPPPPDQPPEETTEAAAAADDPRGEATVPGPGRGGRGGRGGRRGGGRGRGRGRGDEPEEEPEGSLRDEPEKEEEEEPEIGRWPNLRPLKKQTGWPYKGPYPHPKPPVPHPAWTAAAPPIDYSAAIIAAQKENDDAAEGAGAFSREHYMSAPGARDHVVDAFVAAQAKSFEEELAKGTDREEAREISIEAGQDAAEAASGKRPPAYEAKDMAGVTFDDLEIVCGKPYLYVHMEEPHCEHPIVFRDVRLAHPDDPVDRRDYPARLFVGRKYRRKCQMCDVFEARHVTHKDRHAPCHPCFFCDQCFNCLHLNKDGEPWYTEYEHNFYHHE